MLESVKIFFMGIFDFLNLDPIPSCTWYGIFCLCLPLEKVFRKKLYPGSGFGADFFSGLLQVDAFVERGAEITLRAKFGGREFGKGSMSFEYHTISVHRHQHNISAHQHCIGNPE
jgi:hypothetical protein